MTSKATYFTAAGDDGTTALFGQTGRVPKYSLRPEAYGSIDEAQAALGVLRAGDCQPRTKELVLRVERDLYLMMSQLATANDAPLTARPIDQRDIAWLEAATTEIGGFTGSFTDFVLPGDTLSGAQTHLARTIIRRAERKVAKLCHAKDLKNPFILKYLNRLSSLLFVLALYEDRHGGVASPTYAKDI
ncbi:MAG: cob(I)yrinic acid a,c-diamide adenosyltransferase [Anaerolineae bacterium]